MVLGGMPGLCLSFPGSWHQSSHGKMGLEVHDEHREVGEPSVLVSGRVDYGSISVFPPLLLLSSSPGCPQGVCLMAS